MRYLCSKSYSSPYLGTGIVKSSSASLSIRVKRLKRDAEIQPIALWLLITCAAYLPQNAWGCRISFVMQSIGLKFSIPLALKRSLIECGERCRRLFTQWLKGDFCEPHLHREALASQESLQNEHLIHPSLPPDQEGSSFRGINAKTFLMKFPSVASLIGTLDSKYNRTATTLSSTCLQLLGYPPVN